MKKKGREINLPLIIIGGSFILAISLFYILIIKPAPEFKNIDGDIVNLYIEKVYEENESFFINCFSISSKSKSSKDKFSGGI